MSLAKRKLILKSAEIWAEPGSRDRTVKVRNRAELTPGFVIAKVVNTLEFGVPGAEMSREEVDKILKNKSQEIRAGQLVVEFINS